MEQDVEEAQECHFDFSPEKMPSDSKILFLENLIEKYKEKIKSATPHTDEMRSLVKQLVNLRLKYLEMKESSMEEYEDVRNVMGHTFMQAKWSEKKAYCEVCCGLIINFFHSSFKCTCCGFCCHDVCLNQTKRICSVLKVQENPKYEMRICPEKGLHKQHYKCAECKEEIGFEPDKKEARLCEYTGLYYCTVCHWNDQMIIPARVIANWDFNTYKVSRPSKSFLRLMTNRPVLNLEEANPFLFKQSEELSKVKLQREEIMLMKEYLTSCNMARKERILLVQLGHKSHFIDSPSHYNLQDLVEIHSGQFLPQLQASHEALMLHIKSTCEVCKGKGNICSICHSEKPIHSFDSIQCQRCQDSMHVMCYQTSGQNCPKCSKS